MGKVIFAAGVVFGAATVSGCIGWLRREAAEREKLIQDIDRQATRGL